MRSRFLFFTVGLIGLAVAFCAGAMVGGLLGVHGGGSGAKKRRFADEERVITPILSSDPAFGRVEILMYAGDGTAYLVGEVATKSDHDRLRSIITDRLGSARESDPLGDVRTAEGSAKLAL